MLSLDIEDRLKRNTLKWFVYGSISLILAIIITFIDQNVSAKDWLLYVFIILLIFTLVVYLIGIFNLSIWLKIKKVIDTYHEGNYEKAKDLAVSAYKLSNNRDIKELIDYIDSQIIDEIVSEQEKYENPDTEDNEFLQDINELIEEIETRIKKLMKIKQEIAHKLNEVKQHKSERKDIQQQYSSIVEQYSELQEFTELKLQSYREVLNKIQNLKNKYSHFSQLWEEKEDLRDFQEKLASEGFKFDEEDENLDEFFKNETKFLEYIKEFLATSNNIDDPEEFQKLHKELMEQLENLERK